MKPLDAMCENFIEKARCCLRGDRQLAYADYDPLNVYAPVASHDSIRLLLSMAANQDLLLEGADVSNAYLYGDLDVPIFIEQPTNSTQREQMPDHVCHPNKSLYRTKQAREIWSFLLAKSLKSLGTRSSNYDHRIYFYKKNNEFVIIAIVADGLALASNSPKLLDHHKSHLSANFDVILFGA